jgi:hypothetical protein
MKHAWLERDGVAYDAVQNKSYTVQQYEKEFSARKVAAYNLKEACTLIGQRGYIYDYLPEPSEEEREAGRELLERLLANPNISPEKKAQLVANMGKGRRAVRT